MSPTPPTHALSETAHLRPRAEGKFLFVGDEKLYVRGVTYGTFAPQADGTQYGSPELVARDFAAMREAGVNAVRTYTVPPRWLLDLAARNELYVMVGLPWEQHVTFLDGKKSARDIERRVREAVRECAGHPAVLCYTVGNEIPAPIVRWHGRRRVERFLEKLYRAVKEEDPDALVTYVNYPSTEYLQLDFVDFLCFNVYLEQQDKLEAYLARLQNMAGDRPLVMAEIGLDSRRHGEEKQAAVLDWQVRACFAAGCAGAFLFAWTDEWWRGGYDIEDWDFGLVTRDRRPKPALAAVRQAFKEIPFPAGMKWPRVSVVVCTYNGGRVIRDCMEGLTRVEYPDFEVIVVNDGSTDDTASIVSEYPFRLISTWNRGLSAARNTGMEAATGEIVAYTDDDARPDPHWLQYLAYSYMKSSHVGMGGPNVAPSGDGWIADCVANAPGGPVHVLLDDSTAEHIPGCNMSFRREALLKVGGCDARYRVAGDDVDLCWRVQQQAGTIGFSPAALVWHHRRNSVKTYWRQQQGYGKAEALLEAKWPEKYNAAGHLAWAGRLYGKGWTHALRLSGGRVQHGTWGGGLFQSLYEPAPGTLTSLPLMPEWLLVVGALGALSLAGLLWTPLLVAAPLFVLALAAVLAQSLASARRARFTTKTRTRAERLKMYAVTALLHLMQPAARLKGRLRWGLTPWRARGTRGLAPPWPRTLKVWSERWRAAEDWLGGVERGLRERGAAARRGGEFDRWDLEVRGGLFGSGRVLMTVEEHGGGKQFARFRLRPVWSVKGALLTLALLALASAAAADAAYAAAALLCAAGLFFAHRALYEASVALHNLSRALRPEPEKEREQGREELPAALPQTQATREAAPALSETMALAEADALAEPPARARAAGAGFDATTVPPSAVSSVGSSLFLDPLPARAPLGLGELQYHHQPGEGGE
ncbi:MAG TPA: glycosyltransferase [Pyrinomonadaceae bacterium]|nr:glycosyltransferase [Pyrinomonadaceae bacterium]